MADEPKTNLPQEPVKPETSEVDYEAKIKELEDSLLKVAAERENYKKVALARKKEGSEDEEEIDEKMRRIAREEALATQAAQISAEKQKLIDSALRENKELKVALKNRAQVGTSVASGGGQGGEVVTDYFTSEQKAALKRRFDKLPLSGKTFDQFLDEIKANDLKLKNK